MSEIRRITKKYYLRQIVACWLVFYMLFCFGIPLRIAKAEVVMTGNPEGAITVSPLNGGTVQNMTAIDGSIGYFSDFDIASGHTVNCEQFDSMGQVLDPTSQALFKVFGNGTEIYGTFNANGCIWLIDSAGILVGDTGVINVNQFVASTLNITNQDFLDGKYDFSGDSGSIINNGTIISEGVGGLDSMVALIGQKVLNTGTISAPGGVVVMAAGDRVLLGEPGSKIIVEMSSATGDIDGVGTVINEYVDEDQPGTIESSAGQIVLAAGDIYSIPLHPQLQVNSGTPEDPVYEVDDQPVRVETGSGRVEQRGKIFADGGSVILTAGNTIAEDDDPTTLDDEIADVILGAGSLTQAIGGEVIAYAYDFSTKGDTSGALTSYEDGATVSVGGEPGFVGINGNHILFDGVIDADVGAKIVVDPVNLTIANGDIPPSGAAPDTLYEQQIEAYSQAGVDLDLAADDMITVKYMTDDGEILGGSGDISLRNVFDTGGIYFERSDEGEAEPVGPRTTIHTTAFYDKPSYRDGGNIFMIAGNGGIIAGDLIADTLSSDPYSDPGAIRLLTTNGGDIEVGEMFVDRGGFTEISAIASGNLTVNGDAISRNTTVPKDEKSVGQARICLIAGNDYDEEDEEWEPKNVVFNGDVIEVQAHGKFETTADIRISATGNVYIGSAENQVKISAEAKTSESKDAERATAYTVIHAGRTNPDPGEIIVNGDTYTSGSGFLTSGDITAKAWPGPLSIDTDGTPTTTDGTKSVWEETDDPPEKFFVRIEINNDEALPLGEGPCFDCPPPPGLPPVPAIFWIVDDEFDTNWRAGNIAGFDPAELDVLLNDNGIKFDADIVLATLTTDKGGTLAIVYNSGEGFYYVEYTPPTDQPFEWDGVSDYASFTDTFEYQATKEVDGETVYSKNTATVTITVKNILPVLDDEAAQTIHMNTQDNPSSAEFDLVTVFELPTEPLENTIYIIDEDGTPGENPGEYGTLEYGIVEGVIPVSNADIDTDSGVLPYDPLTMPDGDTIKYVPLDGYVSPPDTPYKPTTFGYSVTDDNIKINVGTVETPVYETAEFENADSLEVIVLNDKPYGDSWLGKTQMDTPFSDRSLDDDPAYVDGFTDDNPGDTIKEIVIAGKSSDDYNKSFGGELTYDGTYDYDPTAMGLPGYVGDEHDDFTDISNYVADDKFDVGLWDGERTYSLDDGVLNSSKEYGSGTISLDIENTPPEGDAWFGKVHMDSQNVIDTDGLESPFGAGIDVKSDTYTGSVIVDDGYGNLIRVDVSDGSLEYDAGTGTWTYNAPKNELPGYTGDDVDDFPYNIDENADHLFTVDLSNGEFDYLFNDGSDPGGEYVLYAVDEGVYAWRKAVFAEGVGTVSVDLTNKPPTGEGDLGTVPADTVTVKQQIGFDSPVSVEDQLDPGQVLPDNLEIFETGPSNPYIGSEDGKLYYYNGEWVYEPKAGFVGEETFTVKIGDGERSYVFDDEVFQGEPVVSYAEVKVTIEAPPPPPLLANPPVPVIRAPEVEGCPAVIEAAADEIGVPKQTVQIWIGQSLASGVDIQPCDVCSRLISNAAILRDETGARLAALAEIINAIAPADVPFTPELGAQIAAAFEENLDEDVRYATAQEYIDALVAYVLILQGELPGVVEDPVAFTMDKYGSGIMEQENANIGAFVGMQLEGVGGL